MSEIVIHGREFEINTKIKDYDGNTREINGFIITEISGKRVYMTAIKNGIRLTKFAKNLFIEGDSVILKFNKQKIKIGTFKGD